ncbi:repressor [Cedecea neteri]|uniref:Repressor n=1 Tax=Cedecea neteri TaxID=158822 RepID=A0AAN0VSF4_9ENTR|nr:toxin-antitoxin system HicB family antitoxin [Cedecea neteri]AIR59937.1 repressor [Cedecea neteri]
MSIISREKKPKGGGKSPQFKMRIDPALKEQLDAVAAEEGISLANWLKNLAREALKARGIAPKG